MSMPFRLNVLATQDVPLSKIPPLEQATMLHNRLYNTVRFRRRAMREIAMGLVQMRDTKLHRELGFATIAEYGEQALEYSRSKTRQLLKLGDRLPGLPVLDDAMREGLLGWTKARTVAGVATADNEAEWVEYARRVSSRELEDKAWVCNRGDPPPADQDDIDPFVYVNASFKLHAVNYERYMQALASIRARYDDPNISADQLLMIMVDRELQDPPDDSVVEGEQTPATHGENATNEHYRVIEHRCPDCQSAWVDTPAGKMTLDAPTRAMIECDAQVVDGTTGKLTRTIPPTVRRAVLIRDHGTCQVPGCTCRRHVELHHLQLYSEGGQHHADNLLTVCSAHHAMLHNDVMRLARAPDGTLVVTRLAGEPLGMKVAIFNDRAELGSDYLEEFTGPAGSWCCLEGYFGHEMVTQAKEAAAQLAHVYQSKASPKELYAGGRGRFVAVGVG